MERKKRKGINVTEGKRNIITALINEYDIKNAEDIQDALKDLLGGTIQEMLEAEMTQHLGYEPYERSETTNARNGRKVKTIHSKYGEADIEVPQDREGTFEPQIVKKCQKDISAIEDKIISMYAKGMTTRQISEQIEEWQQRPLFNIYPVVFVDAIHFSVRDNGIIKKKAAYIILGINEEGKKDVLSIEIGENESSKYWLGVFNNLKNRGIKDILILCADGLSGMKEAIAVAFPKTEYQRCIVHQVRNTLKYVSYKDRKHFADDLKTIYQAPSEQIALKNLEKVTEKWEKIYPNSMKSWSKNWDAISPIFKFSMEVRKVIYTTNAIESLNSVYRRLNSQRSVFPSDISLLKSLYLATFEATKKWTSTLRNWGKIYGELQIMFEEHLS